MDSLKNIVTSAGSIGTLSGFIGGVQTLAVWGIIVIIVAGFVFLAIYIKSLNSPHKKQPPQILSPNSETSTPKPTTSPASTFSTRRRSQQYYPKVALAAVFGLSLGTSSTLFYNLLNRQSPDSISNPTVLSAVVTPTPERALEPTQIPEEFPIFEEAIQSIDETETTTITTIIPTTIPTATPTATLVPKTTSTKKVIVTPSINSYVNLRSTPDRDSALITKILSGQELIVVGDKYNSLGEKWLNVTFNQFTGWILAELTQAIENPSTAPSAKINILVPTYDVVYLYSRPSFNASITSKISETQSADILVETKRWAKVILTRVNVEGWISQDFIEKNIP